LISPRNFQAGHGTEALVRRYFHASLDLDKGTAMRAFVRRFLMHYGIYRRYPLARIPAFRNAWRISRA
jgi:hypothetical protein